MEVVSVGKRLRNIRRQFGIRQDQITGDLITRNMISMIETEKASLTPKVAKMVAEQINRICLERSINFSISAEALLESENVQVRNNTIKLTEEIIEGNFNLNDERNKSVVLELENKLAIDGEYNVAFSLDEACENYFSERNQYFEAYYYCKRSVDLSVHLIDDPRTFKAYNNISFYLIHLERYSEALHYCNMTLEKFCMIAPEDHYKVLMNKNLAASKLGDRKLSVEAIDAMLEITGLSLYERSKALISKANSLAEDENWQEAIKIYNKIYPDLKSTPQQFLILSNLIDIYISIEDLENLQNIMDRSLAELKSEGTSEPYRYLDKIFFKLAKGFLYLGKEELFLEYWEKAYSASYNEKLHRELKTILEFKITYCCEKKNDRAICEVGNLLKALGEERIVKRDDLCVWKFMSCLAELKDVKNLVDLTTCFLHLN